MLSILENQTSATVDLSDAQAACLATIANQVDALNAAMRCAVDAGMTIELRRAARHHQDEGHWGDIIAPMVRGK